MLPTHAHVVLAPVSNTDELALSIKLLAQESRTWLTDRLLVDASNLPKKVALRAEFALGALVAEHLLRFSRIAVLAHPSHSGGGVQRVARSAGIELMVFTSVDHALEWLQGGDEVCSG